jgi:uncharacterized protein
MTAYRKIENPKFKYYVLNKREDVFHAMKEFFKKQTVEA